MHWLSDVTAFSKSSKDHAPELDPVTGLLGVMVFQFPLTPAKLVTFLEIRPPKLRCLYNTHFPQTSRSSVGQVEYPKAWSTDPISDQLDGSWVVSAVSLHGLYRGQGGKGGGEDNLRMYCSLFMCI